MRETWLNGWPRIKDEVFIGSALHCAGCGKFHGIICTIYVEGCKFPEKLPDWPFEEKDCPLCLLRDRPTLDRKLILEQAKKNFELFVNRTEKKSGVE